MKRLAKFSTVVFMFVSFFCTPAASLTIQGTVTDTSAKPISNALVVVTNESTFERTFLSIK